MSSTRTWPGAATSDASRAATAVVAVITATTTTTDSTGTTVATAATGRALYRRISTHRLVSDLTCHSSLPAAAPHWPGSGPREAAPPTARRRRRRPFMDGECAPAVPRLHYSAAATEEPMDPCYVTKLLCSASRTATARQLVYEGQLHSVKAIPSMRAAVCVSARYHATRSSHWDGARLSEPAMFQHTSSNYSERTA